MPMCQRAMCDVFNKNINLNVIQSWQDMWESASVFGSEMITYPEKLFPGTDHSSKFWVKLNRLRTHQGRCNKCLFTWGIVPDPSCDCGAVDKSICHIVCFGPLRRFDGSFEELFHLSSERAKDWLMTLDIEL